MKQIIFSVMIYSSASLAPAGSKAIQSQQSLCSKPFAGFQTINLFFLVRKGFLTILFSPSASLSLKLILLWTCFCNFLVPISYLNLFYPGIKWRCCVFMELTDLALWAYHSFCIFLRFPWACYELLLLIILLPLSPNSQLYTKRAWCDSGDVKRTGTNNVVWLLIFDFCYLGPIFLESSLQY